MIFYRDQFKKLRELRGMTMTDFAKQASVTKQCIEQWEKGKSQPRAAKLSRLAEIFHCEISDISDLADPNARDTFAAVDEKLSFIIEKWDLLTEVEQAEIFGIVKGCVLNKKTNLAG